MTESINKNATLSDSKEHQEPMESIHGRDIDGVLSSLARPRVKGYKIVRRLKDDRRVSLIVANTGVCKEYKIGEIVESDPEMLSMGYGLCFFLKEEQAREYLEYWRWKRGKNSGAREDQIAMELWEVRAGGAFQAYVKRAESSIGPILPSDEEDAKAHVRFNFLYGCNDKHSVHRHDLIPLESWSTFRIDKPIDDQVKKNVAHKVTRTPIPVVGKWKEKAGEWPEWTILAKQIILVRLVQACSMPSEVYPI